MTRDMKIFRMKLFLIIELNFSFNNSVFFFFIKKGVKLDFWDTRLSRGSISDFYF